MLSKTIIAVAIAGLGLMPADAAAQRTCSPGREAESPVKQPEDAERGCPLTTETTFAQIREAFGEAIPGGPGGEMLTYRIAPDRWLWLTFSDDEPRRLSRAVLVVGSYVPTTRIIVDALAVTQARRRDQLDLGRALSARDVYAAWGPPDNVYGSGLEIWTYRLADGSWASLVFAAGRLATVDGRAVGPAVGGSSGPMQVSTVEAVRGEVQREGEIVFMGTTPESTHAAPPQTYIMALFADTSDSVRDYVWFHHARDGSWFARGGRFVTNLDAAGQLLVDPRSAARDYGAAGAGFLNYEHFVGYFAVRPGAIPVQRQ